jgi:hypothetical protein
MQNKQDIKMFDYFFILHTFQVIDLKCMNNYYYLSNLIMHTLTLILINN